MTTEPTLFEKIIKGEISSYKVYEDENTYAFLDISPSSKGHTLVVPKNPHKDIHELPEEELHQVFNTVKKLSTAIKESLQADGIKILMHNGKAAGQVIFHAHVHIIPRYENDTYPKYKYEEGEQEEIIEKIKENLN